MLIRHCSWQETPLVADFVSRSSRQTRLYRGQNRYDTLEQLNLFFRQSTLRCCYPSSEGFRNASPDISGYWHHWRVQAPALIHGRCFCGSISSYKLQYAGVDPSLYLPDMSTSDSTSLNEFTLVTHIALRTADELRKDTPSSMSRSAKPCQPRSQIDLRQRSRMFTSPIAPCGRARLLCIAHCPIAVRCQTH